MQLLKILSMNHYDLEENCRMEMLVEFKVSYGHALKAVTAILTKFRTDMDEKKKQAFLYTFFPFLFGIYPYTVVTEKQKVAMRQAGVEYTDSSLYELTFTAVRRMLENISSVSTADCICVTEGNTAMEMGS